MLTISHNSLWINSKKNKFGIMKNLIILIFTILSFSYTSNAQKVFSTDHTNLADVKVYVVKHENLADLKVYKVKHSNLTGKNNGIWFFTEHSNLADKKIYFVDHSNLADIKIYFVDHKNLAGWRNKSKMHLMY